jgi:hypothetical protein
MCPSLSKRAAVSWLDKEASRRRAPTGGLDFVNHWAGAIHAQTEQLKAEYMERRGLCKSNIMIRFG